MKRRIAAGILVTVMVWWSIATAALDLGPLAFGTRPSPSISAATSYKVGAQAVPRLGFLARVGGVAFGAVAQPRDGAPTSITFTYEPRRPDGQRVRVHIDGENLSLDMPDWIAVPTARWAGQDSIELVTAFGGEETDVSRDRRCSHLFSYADELRGTLLGLRLMQADLIGMFGEHGELFKQDGAYVLGHGETAPSVDEIERRRAQWDEVVPIAMLGVDSYVLTDVNAAITFSAEAGRVVFEGGPTYMLWRLGGMTSDEIAQVRGAVSELDRTTVKLQTVIALMGIRDQAAELPQQLKQVMDLEVSAVASLSDSGASSDELRRELLVHALAVRAGLEVVIVPEAENPLAKPEVLAGLNSQVHDAATSMSRAAALYRYAREVDPAAWKKFVRKLPRRTTPSVELPTTITSDCDDGSN